MVLRLSHYVTALVFLSASAVVYQNVVVPMIRAPQVESIALAPPRAMTRSDSLHDLFPEESWQRASCKQLQTADGMLLFQQWKQINDDQWKLWPITLIIGRGMSGDHSRAPIVMQAAEGAEIKFAESLDVMSGGAPPIDRGRMIGPVRIYRTNVGDDDYAIDLHTANVGIDQQKIWTTESIEMQVGQAHMVGRDLTIHLAGPATGSGGGGGVSSILHRMELIYLDQFVMPLAGEGFRPAQGGPPASGGPAAMVSLKCGGRVEYDFAIDRLTLHDSVSLIHHEPGSLANRFDCERLELTLNDPTDKSIPRERPLDWLHEILATGSPAVANLQGMESELAAERIEFDARAGLVRANGSRGIYLKRGGISARLARTGLPVRSA